MLPLCHGNGPSIKLLDIGNEQCDNVNRRSAGARYQGLCALRGYHILTNKAEFHDE
jgi:hypothetical protein